MRQRATIQLLPQLIVIFVVDAVLVGAAGLMGLQATHAQLDAITGHIITEVSHS